MSDECSIEDCAAPLKSKGFCASHYKRLLFHGDPLGGRPTTTGQGEAKRYFYEVAAAYEGNECLLWPYAKDPHGYAKLRSLLAHRVMCEIAHGGAPTPHHQAAHLCGRGHLGCIAKSHLAWKTRKENEADKIKHGTAPRGERSSSAKLTASQVHEIRASIRPISQRQMAAELGVSQTTISKILSGKHWKEHRT